MTVSRRADAMSLIDKLRRKDRDEDEGQDKEDLGPQQNIVVVSKDIKPKRDRRK